MTMPRSAKYLSAGVLLALAAASLYLLNRHESDTSEQSTDDAYVQADFTLVAPRLSGQISRLLVKDHQSVAAGQLVAELDNQDQQAALAAARADVLAARANVEGLKAQASRQGAVIAQAGAAVSADDASLALARANQRRYRDLSSDGSGSQQDAQQAEAQLRISAAAKERDQAALAAARLQSDIIAADLHKAEAALARSEAARHTAELNLSYTRISAPVAGTVGRLSARVGSYVTTGTPLMAVVPLQAVYIEANYRETQLASIRPGQAVNVQVDTLPGVSLNGRVSSLAPASGMAFAPIAPQNATGNFTKVVQRLPVRIQLDPGQPALRQLRVGMSVQPTIYTR